MSKIKISLIILLGLVIIAVFSSACISETVSSTNIQTKAPTNTPDGPLVLDVGQSAVTSELEVTVYSADISNHYKYYSKFMNTYEAEIAEPGKEFLLIDAMVQYTGSDSTYASGSDFSLEDSEGYRYDTDIMYLGDDGFPFFQELYANQKTRGILLFIIPENSNNLKLYYNFGSLWTGTNLAYWKIN